MNKAYRLIILTIFVALLSVSVAFGARVVLPEDTPIKVKFDPAMEINSGRVTAGIPLLIFLAEDVKIGGKTVIEAGAQGKAEVIEVVKASKPGKPGYIKIAFTEMGVKGEFKTQSGESIKLKGEYENQGKGRSFFTKIPFLYGFFISGHQGKVDSKLIYPVNVSETIILESE